MVGILFNTAVGVTNGKLLNGDPNFPSLKVEVGLNATASNAESFNYFIPSGEIVK